MILQRQAQEVRIFLYSQALADGLRATFAILLPALAGFYLGHFDVGLTISLGAMCVSLTDAPGPIIHKRNGMLFCAAFAFVVALTTGFAQHNLYVLGLEIAFFTFLFSMFTVYGNRASAVGNAAVLVMILIMDRPVSINQVLPNALLIFSGGLFYLTISLLLYTIRPYRYAERVLGDCIREIAVYLSIKADFYNTKTNLDDNYKKLIAQQVLVNETQDAVREVFFKTRQIVEESTEKGRRLVFTFIETVDLFEDITAAYYDYDLLRKEFENTGTLEIISTSLKKISLELTAISIAIQTSSTFTKSFDYDEEIKKLKIAIDSASKNNAPNNLVLKKIIVNIRNLLADANNITLYFETDIKRTKSNADHSHFVSHQSLDPTIIWDNLNLESSVFRHAIRVCAACSIGFIVSKGIAYGHHSYWILLTIAFILKPAFSLTKQRNVQRIKGTLAGGVLGILILVLIPDKNLQFVFMVFFMIGTYSFMRINYLVMVICTTPYILILFSFLGSGFKDLVQERILDTLVGCTIAFLASYLLFPRWESEQLKSLMKGILKANAVYMQKIIDALLGKQVSMLEYKLARKDVYLNSANLSAAFQRMLSEPKSKQSSTTQIHQFVVLNHILFSNIATIATTLLSKDRITYPDEIIALAGKTHVQLQESILKLGQHVPETYKKELVHHPKNQLLTDEHLLKKQLEFIYRVSRDIQKTTALLTRQ